MERPTKLDKNTILDCYGSKNIKIVDLTEVLSKFSELFSITPFEPELKQPFDLNPDEAILPPPTYTNKRNEIFMKPKIAIPKSPFSNNTICNDPTIRGWYYIDEADITQGPFTALEMDNWFDNGFLFNELLVKFETEDEFQSLFDKFGKVEYPARDMFQVTRKIERRASTKDEELPSLGFGRIHSYTDQKMPFQRSVHHRFSCEEGTGLLSDNIWKSFLDKKNDSQPQKQTPEIIPESKEDSMTPTLPQEGKEVPEKKPQQIAASNQVLDKKEEKETVTSKSMKAHEGEEAAKKSVKADDRKSQDIKAKEDQHVASKKEALEPKAKKSLKKGESETADNHNFELEQHEEKKTSKKNKKSHKSPKNQHLVEPDNDQHASAHHQGHSHPRDKRFGKGKYLTVFEPKIDQQELKDKAQEAVSKDDTKHSVGGVRHHTETKTTTSKNSQFFEVKDSKRKNDADEHKHDHLMKGAEKRVSKDGKFVNDFSQY